MPPPGLIFVSAVKDLNTLPADVLNSLVNAWLIQKQGGLRVVYYAKPVFSTRDLYTKVSRMCPEVWQDYVADSTIQIQNSFIAL